MRNETLMTTGEVAKLAGLSVRTVQRLAESGELAHAQRVAGGPSGIYLFRRPDVERDLAAEIKRTALAERAAGQAKAATG